MSKAITDISFAVLLPPSIAADPTMLAAATAIDAELKAAAALIQNALIWSRIDSITEPLLSYLAWQLHVDYWRTDMSNTIKRNTLKKAYRLHRYKGTVASLKEALEIMVPGVANVEILQWWEYSGDPYHFRVIIDIAGESVLGDQEAIIAQTIDRYKNLRSELDSIDYVLSSAGDVPVVTIAMQSTEVISIYQE